MQGRMDVSTLHGYPLTHHLAVFQDLAESLQRHLLAFIRPSSMVP